MNNSFKIHVIILFILISVLCNLTEGQEYIIKTGSIDQNNSGKVTLKEIENGIAEGNVKTLIDYFSFQTYLSLSNGINGYYSSNQAYYVLEDFFGDYRVSDFKFTDMQIEKEIMYGTGTYTYTLRGKKDEAHVYVALKNISKKWKITQLTIN